MLRMLFIGDLNHHTESSSKCYAFQKLGVDVVALSSEEVPYLPGLGKASGLRDTIKRRLFPMWDGNNINRKLASMVNDKSLGEFDLFWSDKALNLKPNMLQKIRDDFPNLRLVFASGDNMTVPAFRNKAFEDTIGIFDVLVTSKTNTADQLIRMGAKHVLFMPKAFDDRWVDALTFPQKCIDISFIGSFEKERAKSLIAVAEAGYRVDIWGNGWRKLTHQHEKMIVHGVPVYEQALIDIVEKTKINLCFLRKLAKDMSTNRTFEIPACGGFMLAERTFEHANFFQEGVSAEFFNSDQELISKIDYYLVNDAQRSVVASSGHKHCILSGYDYKNRCKKILNEILATVIK